jgi:hypothetical protein
MQTLQTVKACRTFEISYLQLQAKYISAMFSKNQQGKALGVWDITS